MLASPRSVCNSVKRSRIVTFGHTTTTTSEKRLSPRLATLFRMLHAVIIPITVVLPAPVAILQAYRRIYRLPSLCLQDGDRSGQDDRHGDAGRLEHPEQGQRAEATAVSPTWCWSSVRTSRSETGLAELQTRARRGEHLPHTRPGAGTPDAAVGPGQGAGHELARLRAANVQTDGR